MPEAIKTPAPVAAKPVAAPAAAAAAAPAAHPAPQTAKQPETKPAAPVAAQPAAATPTPTPAPVAEKRKPGRPLGAKSKPKAPVKSVAAKPASAPVTAKVTKAPAAKPAPMKFRTTHSVAPLAAATPSEGSKTMNDTIATMQDTAKKYAGEASARAKGAYERSVKLTEEFTEFQKGNVEAMVESSKLAAKAAEKLGQDAADYARKSFETSTAAFKSFASAKSPTELFKLQSDYVKSHFDSIVAESSKVTEAWLKIAGEVAQPLSNRVSLAVDKVKVATAL